MISWTVPTLSLLLARHSIKLRRRFVSPKRSYYDVLTASTAKLVLRDHVIHLLSFTTLTDSLA